MLDFFQLLKPFEPRLLLIITHRISSPRQSNLYVLGQSL